MAMDSFLWTEEVDRASRMETMSAFKEPAKDYQQKTTIKDLLIANWMGLRKSHFVSVFLATLLRANGETNK